MGGSCSSTRGALISFNTNQLFLLCIILGLYFTPRGGNRRKQIVMYVELLFLTSISQHRRIGILCLVIPNTETSVGRTATSEYKDFKFLVEMIYYVLSVSSMKN